MEKSMVDREKVVKKEKKKCWKKLQWPGEKKQEQSVVLCNAEKGAVKYDAVKWGL